MFGLNWNNKRAQASVETIILMAIALLILTVFISIMWNQVFVQKSVQDTSSALIVANTLAKEIDNVYFLGPGTVRTVTLFLPDSIDFSESMISGKTLVLNVDGSDIVAFTSIDVRGSWPTTGGSYVFTLISYGDFVSMNINELNFSPRSITAAVNRSTTKQLSILVNNKDVSKDFTPVIEFSYADGTLATSTYDSSLTTFPRNTDVNIDLNLFCASTSAGTYFGKIIFVPSGVDDYNISLPIKLICLSGQTKLSVLPSTKTINVSADTNTYHSLLVCNSSQSDFSSSSSSISGSIDSFAFTSFSGAITKDNCRDLNLLVRAPSSTGTYLGEVLVTASNITASSNLTIIVS